MKKSIYILLFIFLYACTNQTTTPSNIDSTSVQVNHTNDMELDSNQHTSTIEKEIEILTLENGTFGYFIQYNGMKIKQITIPSAAGKNGFHSKEDAEKVASLVLQKIKRNEMPPTVSSSELDSLQVVR
jgi:hypothetical protein